MLNALIGANETAIARELWTSLVSGPSTTAALIFNGGFESDILKNFSQFDWTFGRSEYARLSIDRSVARSGERSLKIEFAGRDTTTLDDGIHQLVVVRPDVRYRITYYIKSDGLMTTEGPRVVVTDKSGAMIAASDAVAEGTNDWKPLAFEFTVPKVAQEATAIYVSVKRKPKYAYDHPTKGTVWFDDFTMTPEARD